MKKIVLICFVCLISTFITSGQHPVITGSSRYFINYSKHAGYVILIDGKKLQGVFEYAEMEFPDYNLKFYASEKGPLISRIKFKEINFIALAGSDTTIIKTDSTYFFNLKKDNRLYRKLTSGEIEIFDNLFNVTERPGLVHEEDLLLIIKGKLTRIHSRKELIQLLEKYGHSFQPEDTVTLGAIIKAINSGTVLQ